MKQQRQSIPPEAVVIGEYKRLRQRIGRPVTQEEVAEAIGVSREWYCRLENGKYTDATPELVKKIASALHDRRTARRVQWAIDDGATANLADVRRYVKRISSASTYFDAAVEAIETGAGLLSTTCVSIINLEVGSPEPYGHAVGPRARFWTPLSHRICRDAHSALRHGGVGVSEYVPTVDEVVADPSVVLTFEQPSDCHRDYEYECTPDLWREFNRELGVRSVIAAPLRDRNGYRGTVAFSWAEPRKIELREIELVRNLTAVLELIS